MNFKINTERKELILLGDVKWKELDEFMHMFINPADSQDWLIKSEIMINSIPTTTPIFYTSTPLVTPYRNTYWWNYPGVGDTKHMPKIGEVYSYSGGVEPTLEY